MSAPRIDRRELMAGAVGAAAWLAARPAEAQAAPVSFLAVGDWGRGGGRSQRAVARAMAEVGADLSSRFVISVGDNFYPGGVRSAHDPQWKASFENVYDAASLQTPWLASLGNHDYRGKPSAQVAYSRKNPRWHMPARYYVHNGAVVGAPDLEVFVLDTTPITGGRGEVAARLTRGRISVPHAKPQVAWFEAQLARSQAPWKIVVGHHPIRSGGHHGGHPELSAHIEPLLERYGVQAYLCGHDHALQHVRAGRTHHICTGAGSSAGEVAMIPGSRFALGEPGFAAFTLASDSTSLRLAFHDAAGKLRYAAAIDRDV